MVDGQETRSVTLRRLLDRFGEDILDVHSCCGDDTVVVRREKIAGIARFLKDDPELDYNLLVDIAGNDYLPRRPRFEVVYHLLSLRYLHRIRLKVRLSEPDLEVPSLTGLWFCADWCEREVWDMYGIRFSGHPDLRRILMYKEFEGHPLRKDYPIRKRQPLIGPEN